MTMNFKCVNPTNKIVFHARDLNIDAENLILSSVTDKSVPVLNKSISYDNVTHFVIINLDKDCASNSDYKLVVPYSGNIISNLYGFYRGSYVYNGETY